jgi:hypothetical protein
MSFSPIGPIVFSVSLYHEIELIPSRHPSIEAERDIIRLVRQGWETRWGYRR